MNDSTLFEETKPVYIVINHAFRNIKEHGFYDSIFTAEYLALDTFYKLIYEEAFDRSKNG